jgi:hypothetical protein
LVGGGIRIITSLLEHVRGDKPPGQVRTHKEYPAVLSGRCAAVTMTPAGSRTTVVLPTFH